MKKLIPLFIFASCFLLPATIIAQGTDPTPYKLLAPLPGYVPDTTNVKFYLEGLFKLIIAIAGVLAVVMIIFGGIKYMSSEAFEGKSDAKDTIKNALVGLLLAISAWLILNTINPNLVKFDLSLERQSFTPNTNVGGQSVVLGSGPAHLALNQQQAMDAFRQGGVNVDGGINLNGVRQGAVDEILRLQRECNCNITVTSATGGSHESGSCSHGSGYKIDLRRNREGSAMTSFIERSYNPPIGQRSNGDPIYKSSSGALYVRESDHWDVAVCNP